MGIQKTDVENEIRAITKICGAGRHANIVQFLEPTSSSLDVLYRYVTVQLYFGSIFDQGMEGRIRLVSLDQERTPMEICGLVSDMARGLGFIHT
jgi:hypothetical protein